MASKFRPGIPETFSLNVSPVQDLGDYLDEPPPTPRPQKRVTEQQPAAAQPAVPEVTQPVAIATPTPPPAAPLVAPNRTPAIPEAPRQSAVAPQPAELESAVNDDRREERGGRYKAPRREISMTPETLRMSDELLEVIRSGSGQRDTKANELFHALVLLVREAMDEIDTHAIPKRGRWGTPTARAYPLELKNAFLKALLKKYAERDTIELRYEVGGAV